MEKTPKDFWETEEYKDLMNKVTPIEIIEKYFVNTIKNTGFMNEINNAYRADTSVLRAGIEYVVTSVSISNIHQTGMDMTIELRRI